jgi:anti-sigma regulatory factor (Ser/Thr protein kinase)
MFSFEPVAPRAGPASGTAAALTVAAGSEAPAAARNAVGAGLAGRVAEDVLRDARLLVSELVTNSVRHAGLTTDGVVRIKADVTGGILRLEVDDAGTTGTVAARPPRPDGGFGLHLVEALAHRWGVTREGFTRVWVELPAWPSAHGSGNADVRATR